MAMVTVKPASREELEGFISQNKRWLPDDAEQSLRSLSAVDQRRVISAGTMSSVRDPSAIIQARVRKAREMEAQIGRGGGALAADLDPESRISKPAGKEEVDAFIKSNERWLAGDAAELLRNMNPVDQKRVVSAGTLSGCRDPVAVIQTRVKKARQMELEFENLTAGPRPVEPAPAPQPAFDPAAAAMFLYARPNLVNQQESKFAPPPAFYRDTLEVTVGDTRGVGGVVEILKAKYGCGKGQRLRVVGETDKLVQFEGGKTAPQNHEGMGWRWVVREEEEAAKAEAEQAKVAAEQAGPTSIFCPPTAAAAAAVAPLVEQAKESEVPVSTAVANGTSPPKVEEKPSKKARDKSSSSSSSSKSKRKRKPPTKGAKTKEAERKKEDREKSSDSSDAAKKKRKVSKKGKSSSSSSSSAGRKRKASPSSSSSSSAAKRKAKAKAGKKKKAAKKASSSGDSDKEVDARKADKEKAAKAKKERLARKAKAKKKEAIKAKAKKKKKAASSSSSSSS